VTTPERLRRRQRIETALVLVTIVLATLSVFWTDRQNAQQDECVAEQITDLTDALNARSDSTGKLNDATGEVINSFVQAAQSPDDPDNRAPILRALNDYAEVQADVREARRDNPFPPFPTGKCD
jgi:MoxR-like ATPase